METASPYFVNSRLLHNGKTYVKGSTVYLDDASAKRLIDLNVVTPIVLAATAAAPGTAVVPLDDLTKAQAAAHAAALGLAFDPASPAKVIVEQIKAATGTETAGVSGTAQAS